MTRRRSPPLPHHRLWTRSTAVRRYTTRGSTAHRRYRRARRRARSRRITKGCTEVLRRCSGLDSQVMRGVCCVMSVSRPGDRERQIAYGEDVHGVRTLAVGKVRFVSMYF